MLVTKHASDRGHERAGLKTESAILEMTMDAGILAETEQHKYIRNDDFVMVLAKNDEIHSLKTLIKWDEFQNNLQSKIERYNEN